MVALPPGSRTPLAGLRSRPGRRRVRSSFGFLGYWEDSIDTLIITLLAVALCVVIGLPLGIAMARSRAVVRAS